MTIKNIKKYPYQILLIVLLFLLLGTVAVFHFDIFEQFNFAVAEGVPEISISPESIDFGEVEVGSSADRVFTVENVGTGTLIGSANTSGVFSCVSGCSYSLTSGQTQNITIRFSPTQTGDTSGSVEFSGGSVHPDYYVYTDFDFINRPEATNFTIDYKRYCSVETKCTGVPQKGSIGLRWTYDGDKEQQSFKLGFANNPALTGAIETDEIFGASPGTTINVVADSSVDVQNAKIGYDKTYYIGVKVKDIDNNWSSNWSNTVYLDTPDHAYPWVCFSHIPTEPSDGEVIRFTDESVVYGGSIESLISWEFESGDPATALGLVATTTLSSGEDRLIELTIRDSSGYECTGKEELDIRFPMPDWTEE